MEQEIVFEAKGQKFVLQAEINDLKVFRSELSPGYSADYKIKILDVFKFDSMSPLNYDEWPVSKTALECIVEEFVATKELS